MNNYSFKFKKPMYLIFEKYDLVRFLIINIFTPQLLVFDTLIFEDTTLFRLYEMKKELNEISVQNELKSIEIEQVKKDTSTYYKQRGFRKVCKGTLSYEKER